MSWEVIAAIAGGLGLGGLGWWLVITALKARKYKELFEASEKLRHEEHQTWDKVIAELNKREEVIRKIDGGKLSLVDLNRLRSGVLPK